MPEISDGEKLRSLLSVSNEKHRSFLISTSARFYPQCINSFEKHFELYSESNREANSKNCNLLVTNTHPSPASAVWVIPSRNTVSFIMYVLNQIVLVPNNENSNQHMTKS